MCYNSIQPRVLSHGFVSCFACFTCSRGMKVQQIQPVKVASSPPNWNSSPLLWRTSRSQISSMKTLSTALHSTPPPPLHRGLLSLCQVGFGGRALFSALKESKKFFSYFCKSFNCFTATDDSNVDTLFVFVVCLYSCKHHMHVHVM